MTKMMTTLSKQLLLMVAVMGLVACGQSSNSSSADASADGSSKSKDKTEAQAANAVSAKAVSSFADLKKVAEGKIEWEASKVVGKHMGTVDVARGQLNLEGDKVTGGEFVIDMGTINVNDLEGKDKKKLEGHLASKDFFHVKQHPSAVFKINKAQPIKSDKVDYTHRVTGNLTIRGNTHEVAFMANVKKNDDGTYSAKSEEFTIDRKKYGIEYQVPTDKWTKGAFIEDDIKLKINVDKMPASSGKAS